MRIVSMGASSKGNCHYVEMDDSKILLDAGVNIKEIQIATGFKTYDLDGVLLTHEHKDHCRAIKSLMTVGIDVYSSQGTFDALGIKHHRANAVKSCELFNVGPLKVLPLGIEHDAAEPFAYVVDGKKERLLYITDTCYLKYDVKGVTHLIVECNYDTDILREAETDEALKRRVMKSHTSLQTVEKMLNGMDKSMLQHVYLTHLSDRHSDEKRFRERVQRLTGVEVSVFAG